MSGRKGAHISQAKQFLACAPTKVFVNIKNPNTNTESSTSVSEFLLLMVLLLSVDCGGTSKQTDSFVSLCTSDMSIIISYDGS